MVAQSENLIKFWGARRRQGGALGADDSHEVGKVGQTLRAAGEIKRWNSRSRLRRHRLPHKECICLIQGGR
jgi:hypothetical protein